MSPVRVSATVLRVTVVAAVLIMLWAWFAAAVFGWTPLGWQVTLAVFLIAVAMLGEVKDHVVSNQSQR